MSVSNPDDQFDHGFQHVGPVDEVRGGAATLLAVTAQPAQTSSFTESARSRW
jgi:hypothetical protein